MDYEIVAIRGKRSLNGGLSSVSVFVRANNEYYFFDCFKSVVEGMPTEKRGDIPLENWFTHLRKFSEDDYKNYPEFVEAIDKYFKER